MTMRPFAVAFLAMTLSCALGGARTGLAPSAWLRPLRFSPDGRYILAQDDAEIQMQNNNQRHLGGRHDN
jgi:hypothetical protein